ncbi:helix-turn-helix domain-containing protein [Streptomyces xanthophaeus]|uniref:helix-turn-helix domain-containing protein n=1 Tax=Streptomyces xanthophaeus TaxID=67385 RepID=UPI00371003FE
MHQAPTTFQVEGAAICTKRMQAGISVKHLAEQVGCTDSYLRKLERGTRSRMGPELYVRLRTALAATDHDLLVDHEE